MDSQTAGTGQAHVLSGCCWVCCLAGGTAGAGESGDGEVFHNEYQKAKEDEDAAFRARFYAWWQHEEYEADPGENFQRTDDEKTISERFRLDLQFGVERANRKLEWRRAKRAEPGIGNLFAQEYPGDDKEAFLVSGQRYFTEWNPDTHAIYFEDFQREPYFEVIGGYDWGHFSPACFLLACVDGRGRVIVIDKEYNAGLTDPEQAQKVVECLKRNNLRPDQVIVRADPAMWVAKTDWSGKRVANVAAFHKSVLCTLI